MNANFDKPIRRAGLRAALSAAAISCGIALTSIAEADERSGEPLTKVVNYADLNVNAEPGARVLYGRLRMAATQVCAPFKGDTLRQIATWSECFDQAIARSVKQIDQPVLTAYHLSRTGKAETPVQVAKDQ
jgi:UrcA family protein